MRVDLRGLQVRVPQHLLDKADVRAVVQHQRRHRVTEQVTRSGFAHIGLLDVFGYQAAQPIRRQRQTIWLDKDLLVVRLHHKAGADLCLVFLYPLDGPLANWHKAVFLAFALSHRQHTLACVQIGFLQIHQFHAADAGAVEHFQDRPVPQAFRR